MSTTFSSANSCHFSTDTNFDLLGHASGLAARPDGYYCDLKWFPSALKFFLLADPVMPSDTRSLVLCSSPWTDVCRNA